MAWYSAFIPTIEEKPLTKQEQTIQAGINASAEAAAKAMVQNGAKYVVEVTKAKNSGAPQAVLDQITSGFEVQENLIVIPAIATWAYLQGLMEDEEFKRRY